MHALLIALQVMSAKTCGTKLDHGMLLVGYGGGDTDDAEPFWILQNSWGSAWGEKGYIRLLRGSGTTEPGECGITLSATLPLAGGEYSDRH